MPAETYRCAPGVRFAVETRGVNVLHPATGTVLRLDYPEAAVWDLASRGYRLDRMADLMTHIGGVDRAAAEGLVRAAVRRWAGLGLLEREDGDA